MLPRRLRWMAGTCALISAMTMWGATTDLFTGIRLEAVREDVDQTTAPDYMGELTLHLTRAQLAAWSTMRGERITISIFLSLAAGLAFAASLRLLMPMGLRREGMRVLLVRALLWTAGVRTVAGAADAGAFKYAAESLKRNHGSIPGREQWLSTVPAAERKGVEEVLASVVDHMPSVAVTISIVWTVALAALFVMYWRYFGREDVKATLVAADDAPPPSA